MLRSYTVDRDTNGAVGSAAASSLALLFVLVTGMPARAATYYVDPTAGSNGNNGTSSSTPWMNPPGTRTTSGSGFYGNARWGAIAGSTSSSNSGRIQCGDVILLRPGRTFTNANSGAWCLTSADSGTSNCSDAPWFYATGCASNPIRIKIATPTEWPGAPSTGHVDFDGSGITPTGASDYRGIIHVSVVDGLQLLGLDANRRLRVRDSNGCGFLFLNSTNGSSYNRGNVLDWFEDQNSETGICFGGQDFYRVSNGLITNSGFHCIDIGFHVDWRSGTGVWDNVDLNGCGLGDSVGFNSDNFYQQGGERTWFTRLVSRNGRTNGGSGGSAKQIGQGQNQPVTFRGIIRDSAFLNNGTFSGSGPARAGLAWDGDGDQVAPHSYVFAQSTVFYGNQGPGVWTNHGTGRMNLWNITTFANDDNSAGPAGRRGQIDFDTASDMVEIHNSIVNPAQSYVALDTSFAVDTANGAINPRHFLSNFNLYDFRSSPSATFAQFRWSVPWPNTGGGWSQSGVSFSSMPSQWNVTGGNDYISTATSGACTANGGGRCQARHVSLGGACNTAGVFTYSACDLRLCTGSGTPAGCTAASDAIDRGTFVLRANGAGSGTTINTRRGDPLSGLNGTDADATAEYGDPRNFFISPSTCPGCAGDQIQIEGCGVRTVASLTASSITFAGGACTWSDGVGIHRPWNGARPDIGAFEAGSGGPAAPAPPTLLSVEPL